MELQNYQWELGGVVFGEGCPVDHESDVAPPAYGVRNQDQPQPNGDGSVMGVDYLEPGLWQFKLFTNGEDEASVHAALEELGLAWRADAYRKEPGKATGLRYRMNNRTRVVYGRPRRFEYPFGAEYVSGRVPITADFQTVSELFFDDYENSLDVDFKEPEAGGFVTPFTAPLTSDTSPDNEPYTLTVGGLLATPVMVDFIGPLDNTGILIDGEPFIAFQNDVPGDITATVDARPWVTSVTRSDGGGVAGLLSPRSRMPKMLLEPGEHTVTLLGSTPDGTGKARIRWHSAYPSV